MIRTIKNTRTGAIRQNVSDDDWNILVEKGWNKEWVVQDNLNIPEEAESAFIPTELQSLPPRPPESPEAVEGAAQQEKPSRSSRRRKNPDEHSET